MQPANLTISKLGPESETVLRNLLQLYLHEMAEWFDVDADADGHYAYDTSDLWKNYEVYLAISGDSLVGFALVGSAAEWLGDIGAHDVHEFFIIRGFRRSGFGERLAAFIWDEHPGEWLVRVLEANAAAVLFWRSLVANYANGLYLEEERISKSRPWRFFRFATKTR